MDKLQLQQEIEKKNQELIQLKSDILALQQNQVQEKVNLEQKKIQLEEEKKVLEEQLKELEHIETNQQVTQTQEETEALKNNISLETYSTNELIKESTMYKKLLEIAKTPEDIEIFGNAIDATVKKYLDQELIGFSDEVKNNMSVAIQFSMMDALMKDGTNGADFFESFSGTKTDDGKNVLTWFFGAFSKSDIFFQLANKVQNISQYLNIHKSKLLNQTAIPELSNPYKFMKLLQNDVWKNMDTLYTLDVSTILTLDSTEWVLMSDEEKKLMWDIANNDGMNNVITAKSIAAIEKSLTTANNVLDKRAGFKDTASSLFETIFSKFDSISSISLPFLWNVWELLWFEWPIDILWWAMDKIDPDGKKKKSILDFILTGLWFSGGLTGLHKSYVMEWLDKLMVDENKIYVKDVYAAYTATVNTSVSNTDTSSTGKKLEPLITETDPTKKQAILDKIPADYSALATSLVDSLEDDMVLSKSVVSQFYTDTSIYREDGSVDISLISDKDDFIDKYLQFILPKLANSWDKFINTCPDADTFLVSVAGFLVGGKYFQEAARLWLVTKETYNGNIEQTTPQNQTSETINYSWITIHKLSETWLTHCVLSDVEYIPFTEKVIKIAQNLDIHPEYLMKVMSFETGWTFNPAIKNGAGSWATGLIQFMRDTAIGLGTTTDVLSKMSAIDQLDYVEKYFLPHKWNLKTLEDVYLAVFSPAFIGKPLDYVAYSRWTPAYWLNKWFDTNSDGKMTVWEITETIRTSTKNLIFFDVPVTQVEHYAWNPEILAKSFDQLALVGDSHAGGIKAMWWLSAEQTKNFYYFNGYDTAQLLAKIKEQKTTMLDSWIQSLILVTWANDITKNLVGNMKANLQAIKDEIAPVQLVLPTLQYYADKVLVPDSKVDEVNTIIKNFAQENNLPVIDINTKVSLNSTDYQADKRHLTSTGYTKIVQEITQEVVWDNLA